MYKDDENTPRKGIKRGSQVQYTWWHSLPSCSVCACVRGWGVVVRLCFFVFLLSVCAHRCTSACIDLSMCSHCSEMLFTIQGISIRLMWFSSIAF